MIDLSSLKPDEFEGLCYDLLEHLGLRNLEWRRGQNAGCSTSDDGRDIEGEHLRVDIDGAVVTERWFVECKHWRSAVPPSALDGFFAWANAERPDVALIVSSGALSNPAHEWIKKYERNNCPPYLIKTWEQKPLAGLLATFPDLLLGHGIASGYTSPPLLALWRDLGVHSLEHLFALLDGIPADERDRKLSPVYRTTVLPLRMRQPETGKERLCDLLIDPPDYDKFKRRCFELANQEGVNPSFLSHGIVAAASRWRAFYADPFEAEKAISRCKYSIALFEDQIARLEAGEDVEPPRKGISREDHLDTLRECVADLRDKVASSATDVAKGREILEEWERSVVIPFLNEDQLHMLRDFMREAENGR